MSNNKFILNLKRELGFFFFPFTFKKEIKKEITVIAYL